MRRMIGVAAVLVACVAGRVMAAADGIFPASTDAAKKAISWDSGFFVINGKPTFLASGEIHYARVPRELWRDRILRAKAMGFNCIQTYVMWNAHEGKEGVFSFDDNLDLDAWLSLCQELGMYAIVRPGPYVCAEWENGGLPAWLTAKPGMEVRNDYPEYLKYVDRFEGKVFDIIAKHQIHKGGNVLMVQLENELKGFWGTDENAYTKNLYALAREHGLEVPLFNSGLHHGNDPAGNNPFGARTLPWYSTEFWTGWITKSGEMDPAMFLQKTRGTWKIIAFGGAGYDYYVVHGGTNFGYSKGAEVTASYDYAAPIGEAGQLRNAYWPMKRAAMFARTFNDLLTTSKVGDAAMVTTATPGVKIYTRTSPKGTIAFLDNAGRTAIDGTLSTKRDGGRQEEVTHFHLAAGEIQPLLLNVELAPGIYVDYASAQILTAKKIGGRTYVVVYGPPGTAGIGISSQPDAKPNDRLAAAVENIEIPSGASVNEIQRPNNLTLLVMNTELAERTWVREDSLVIGPHYVFEDGTMEMPGKGGKAVIYSAAGKREVAGPLHDALDPPPALATWRAVAAGEIAPPFDDSTWAASAEPKPMETYDSYPNGYGWYRTTFDVAAAGDVQLKLPGAGDVIRVYLNGKRVGGANKAGAAVVTLPAVAGKNTLAILAFNEGRPKMYQFSGPTKLLNARGVWGDATISGADGKGAGELTWKFHGGFTGLEETALIARVTNWDAWVGKMFGGEAPAAVAADVPVFYEATFSLPLDGSLTQPLALRTKGLKAGSVWLNGHNLGPYKGEVAMYLPECWLRFAAKGEKATPNQLVIFDAEGAKPTGVTLEAMETWERVAVK